MATKTRPGGAATGATPDVEAAKKSREHKVMVVVSVNIVLYAMCYAIQRPVEPYLVDRLGADRPGSDAAANYAKLQSFFSLVQTVGSPVVGLLLDASGSRNAFAAVFVASAASYELLARCDTMEGLYASKLPTLLQHAFLVAQAVVAGSIPRERRAGALGRLMMMYTIGATVGPALGGYLGAKGDYRLGARLAALGSLLSVVLILCFLPSDGNGDDDGDDATKSKTTTPSTGRNYGRILAATWPQLSTKAATAAVASTFQAVSPIVLKERFGVDPAAMGTAMSAQAMANALVGGLALGPITAAFTEAHTVQGCLALLVAGFVALVPASFNLSPVPWVTVGVVLSVAGHALATVLTSVSTSRVGPWEKGTLLGLEHGVFSGVRVLAPTVGMGVFKVGGAAAMSLSCAAVALGTLAAMGTRVVREAWSRDPWTPEKKTKEA